MNKAKLMKIKHDPRFGEAILNKYASEDNPRKYCFFVRKIVRKGKMNPGVFAECTDRNGSFWWMDWEAMI